MDAKRRIGVLGGMGPEATLLFMQRVLNAVDAHDDADHIPLIVDNNTQVPSRIAAIIEGNGRSAGPALAEMAERLSYAGAEALAMPCNTAHHFAGHITASVATPFLNMVELASDAVAASQPANIRVGMLGSPALQMAGVFVAPLRARGLEPIYAADQDEMLSIIREIKANGATLQAQARLQEAAQQMIDHGAGTIMVCCSEFSMLSKRVQSTVPMLDTIDVLVEACVAFSMGDIAPNMNPDLPVAVRRSSAVSASQFIDQQ
ncbi:MAG: amino acid racemase [Pseudomonadota bacterium]